MQAEFFLGNKDIVSIAVYFANEQRLVKLNQKEPLANIIKSLCSEFNLEDTSSFALQFVYPDGKLERNRYVSEENRHEIKDACILRLGFSPSNMVRLIISRIHPARKEDERQNALEKLSITSMDPLFAKMFYQSNGVDIITRMITDNTEAPINISFCLKTLLWLMEHKLLLTLDDSVMNKVVENVVSDKSLPAELVEVSLDILKKVTKGRKSTEEKSISIGIQDLIPHIWNRDCPSVQEKALSLINTIAQSTSGETVLNLMKSKHIRETIYKNIICNKVTCMLAHELYVYQTLVLGILKNQLKPIDKQNMDTKYIVEINSIFARIEKMQNRKGRMVSVLENNSVYGSLGFTTPKCPETTTTDEDFKMSEGQADRYILDKCSMIQSTSSNNEINISHLTLNCILHFARQYREAFIGVAMEEISVSNSFFHTCECIMRLLCELLDVGKPPLSNVPLYQRMFFTATSESSFMEELFCRALLLLGRTRREMKARTKEDQEKVMQIIPHQLKCALQTNPENLEQLDCEIQKRPYSVIKDMLWIEQQEKEKQELDHSPPILQLKQERVPGLIELIKKQRMNVLIKGAKFPKYTPSGRKAKKCFWFICLSSNLKVFQYGDYDKDGNVMLESVNTFAVSNMHMLITGKKCPHMQGNRMLKQESKLTDLAFTLLLKEEPQCLNFMAPDQKSFDLWTDGINVLLGKEMTSGTKKMELNELLDIEVRLQLLDTEGAEIPHKPPPVPLEPSNYNFYYK